MKTFGKNVSDLVISNHINSFIPSIMPYIENLKTILDVGLVKLSLERFYLCPLCLSNHFIVLPEGISATSEFSLDHVPPKSVGGKLELLTCKKCNNTAGEYEAELLKLLATGFTKNVTNAKVTKENSNEVFKGLIKIEKDKEAIIDFNEQALLHNVKLRNFIEDFKEGRNNIKLIIEAENINHITKALLKSAYLICFFHWGYEFIFSKTGELIRKVLRDEIEYPTILPNLYLDKSKFNIPYGLGILQKPSIAKAYYVSVPIKNDIIEYIAMVLIPNPTENGWNDLKEFDLYRKEIKVNHKDEYEFLPLPISIPLTINGYTESWKYFKC